tara:strand:+ start:372 stop:1163 length:792 start_codon:yes stop_codon:yes gene_type:complete
MKTEIRIITPSAAEEILGRNPNNRKITKSHVAFLADQMRSGQWQFDGQPIRFDSFGRLLDGQHRLTAIVESGRSIELLVVSGIDEKAFQVMDTGKRRSGSDSLSAMGIQYPNEIAAAAKMVMRLKKNEFDQARLKSTNTDIINWYEENKEIDVIVKQADSLKKQFSGVMTTSLIATLIYLFNEKSVIHSELFMNQLCNGLAMDNKNPIHVLRKKLIEDRISKSSLPLKEKLALIFKAWNFYRLNKTCKVIRWNKETENFPVIR